MYTAARTSFPSMAVRTARGSEALECGSLLPLSSSELARSLLGQGTAQPDAASKLASAKAAASCRTPELRCRRGQSRDACGCTESPWRTHEKAWSTGPKGPAGV